VDFRTDLWALAVVTYRMLTGELPFKAPTRHALFYAICKGTYTPLASTPAPIELEPWFKRAFEPSKDKRFGSAREMMLRFEQTAATIEDDDDVDEYESTQLLNAGQLMESAKAAWAMRPPSAPPASEDDLAATAYAGDSMGETHDLGEDDDHLPTQEMAPADAQQAVRAFIAQQQAKQQQQQQAQPPQAQPPPAQQPYPHQPPAPQHYPQQYAVQQAYPQQGSYPAATSSAPAFSEPPPLSGPGPESLPQPPISSGGGPFGAARLEAFAPAQPQGFPGQPPPGFAPPAAQPGFPAAPAPAPLMAASAPIASDSPWSGPDSIGRQRRKRLTGVGFVVALLLVLGAVGAYLAMKRPEWLGLAGGAEEETTAEPAAEPPPPAKTTKTPKPKPSATATSSASGSAIPANHGMLTVMCNPSCDVTIDGKAQGPAPLFGKVLPVGKHEITAMRPGFRTKSVRVELGSGERESVNLAMDQPQGARVPAPPTTALPDAP
ncbi:MAG TPA: PEGA domain-containing protein, partial [Polyangiaceae bacterium]|nr:PEGA domain-containing protein [Polyangiaceae bacterium]